MPVSFSKKPGRSRKDQVLLELSSSLQDIVRGLPELGISTTAWIDVTYDAVVVVFGDSPLENRIRGTIAQYLWVSSNKLIGLEKFLSELSDILGLDVTQRSEVDRRYKEYTELKHKNGTDYWLLTLSGSSGGFCIGGIELREGVDRRENF